MQQGVPMVTRTLSAVSMSNPVSFDAAIKFVARPETKVTNKSYSEVNIFGDEHIEEMFAASAVDDADQRSSAAAVILLLLFVALLKLYISGDPLFRPDPFRQGAAQGHARRWRIGQVLLEARPLQRLPQVRMADANPGQPPEDSITEERKLRGRGFHAVQVTNVQAITHKDTSLSSLSAVRSTSSWRRRLLNLIEG